METNYLFLYKNQKKIVYYRNKNFYIKIDNENYNITKCFQKNTNLIKPIYKKKFLLIGGGTDEFKIPIFKNFNSENSDELKLESSISAPAPTVTPAPAPTAAAAAAAANQVSNSKIHTMEEHNKLNRNIIDISYLNNNYQKLYNNFINNTVNLTKSYKKNRLNKYLNKMVQLQNSNPVDNNNKKKIMCVIISDIFCCFFGLNILERIKFYKTVSSTPEEKEQCNTYDDCINSYYHFNKNNIDSVINQTSEIKDSEDFFKKLKIITEETQNYNKDIQFILNIYLVSIFNKEKQSGGKNILQEKKNK
jgi:hypothetical protein